jgi:hypothetical protein
MNLREYERSCRGLHLLISRYSDGLRDERRGQRFDSWQKQEIFSPSPQRSDPGVTHLLIQWLPGVERQGSEADHSPPFNAEVKNDGAIPPLLYMSS